MNDAAPWIATARRRLDAARLLFDANYHTEAISLAFYAMYAAAQALLQARQVHTRTHPGLKRMLSLLYVNSDLLTQDYIRAFDHAFKDRMAADYDARTFTGQASQQRLEQARQFVEAAEALLK